MKKLLFIGAGKMATAIAGGLVRAKLFTPGELQAYDVSETAAAEFTKATGVACAIRDCAALARDAVANEDGYVHGQNARCSLSQHYHVEKLIILNPLVARHDLALDERYHGVAPAEGECSYLSKREEHGPQSP